MKIKSKTTEPVVTAKKTCRRKCVRKVAENTPVATPTTSTKSVTFGLHTEKGKSVYLAGTFNAWNPQDPDMIMEDTQKNGFYTKTLQLAPGVYEYKFVVNGIWCADPECKGFSVNIHGTLNSKITVE